MDKLKADAAVLLGILPDDGTYLKQKDITRMTGIRGADTRRCINYLRSNFYPIISDVKGYRIASDPKDIDHTIACMNSRIHNMIRAREGLKKVQERMRLNAEQSL